MSYSDKISAFSRGFSAGIAGLFSFASPAHEVRVVTDRELQENAWNGVGKAFYQAIEVSHDGQRR